MTPEQNRLAQLAWRLGRAPLLGCLPRNRDKIHRIHAPTSWGGLQRFARPDYSWLIRPALLLRDGIATACTAGTANEIRIDFP